MDLEHLSERALSEDVQNRERLELDSLIAVVKQLL